MKLRTRLLFAIPCLAAFIAVTGSAHASTFSGSVWQSQAPYPASLPANTSGLGAPSATFDVSGINFNSASTSTGYTVGGFLTSGGNTVSNQSASFAGIAGNTLNNTIYEFTGFTDLVAGQTYTVTHDDGAILYIDGVAVINAGTPTAAEVSSFVASATGTFSVDLLYAEVNGAPGVLTSDLVATTPEPSSFILLGSGLLGFAGLVRRRMGV